MPKVDRALVDIGLLRDDVHDLSREPEMTADDQQRLLLRIQFLEHAALYIIDRAQLRKDD